MYADITADTPLSPALSFLMRIEAVLNASRIVMRLANGGRRDLSQTGLTYPDLWAEAERRLAKTAR